METREITNKNVWEKFNLSFPNPSYFQSWYWGEVQKATGVETQRLGFFDGKKLIGIAQVFDIKAKRGHFLYVRQGPVLSDWNKKNANFVLDELKNLAKEKNASFIRISPLLSLGNYESLGLRNFGLRFSPTHNLDAENRWVLDLTPNEDELLQAMRKTTRYLIRHAPDENIKVTVSENEKDLDKFLSIYADTAKNKHFVPHSQLKEEFAVFSKEKKAKLYLAFQKKEILAGAFIVYYGNEAIYRHGATTNIGRKTSASYIAQWQAIKDAKQAGLKQYNFWGIAPTDNPKHPWQGLSLFKKGFGGRQMDFLHAMDLPIKWNYWITFAIDYLTMVKKGYKS
ncbi:MAG: peptidoglycan bridge formation glycyltransferase FemA/FemB family protein [Candidatus Levybacteria bacterium]|nr:peptidoglycan bridge formation glycyltransferase FemA/FemB family protein [Candidatus Levybacteria bacterium]